MSLSSLHFIHSARMIYPQCIAILMLMVCDVVTSSDSKCPTGSQLFRHPGDGNYECLYCSDCPRGSVKIKNCSAEEDTICEQCQNDSYYHDEEPQCRNCSECPPGKFINKACSKFLDTECKPCLPGTYSTNYNSNNCLECTECTKVYKRRCNFSQNAICELSDSKSTAVVVLAVVVAVLAIAVVGLVVYICYYRRICRFKRSQSQSGSPEEGLSMPTQSEPQSGSSEEGNPLLLQQSIETVERSQGDAVDAARGNIELVDVEMGDNLEIGDESASEIGMPLEVIQGLLKEDWINYSDSDVSE